VETKKLPHLRKHHPPVVLLLQNPQLRAQRCVPARNHQFNFHDISQPLFGSDDDDDFFDKKPAASKPYAKPTAAGALSFSPASCCVAHRLCSCQGQELV
jgi:hypothetical protein